MQGMSFEYRGGLSELVNINLAVRFNRFSRVLLQYVLNQYSKVKTNRKIECCHRFK